MSEIAVFWTCTSYFSVIFFFIAAEEKYIESKNPKPLPLYTELVIRLWIQALQCQLKSYHFSSRGSSNTFPLPEATHNSLDPVLSPLRRMFSRAHKFFMGYFFLCLPHRASLQNFLTRLRHKMIRELWLSPHTHTKSLPSHSYKLMVSLHGR